MRQSMIIATAAILFDVSDQAHAHAHILSLRVVREGLNSGSTTAA